MTGKNENELDFNAENYNGFYYTNSKQIKKIDDTFILSKIIERYPDFTMSKDENILRQVFMVFSGNTRLIKELTEKYELSVDELFSIIFRNYSFIFNGCFISKLQKIINGRAYTKRKSGIYGTKKAYKRRKSSKRKTI